MRLKKSISFFGLAIRCGGGLYSPLRLQAGLPPFLLMLNSLQLTNATENLLYFESDEIRLIVVFVWVDMESMRFDFCKMSRR